MLCADTAAAAHSEPLPTLLANPPVKALVAERLDAVAKGVFKRQMRKFTSQVLLQRRGFVESDVEHPQRMPRNVGRRQAVGIDEVLAPIES